MARQDGIIKVSGGLEDLVFYTVNGKHYVRRKGSLDRDRVMRDKAFARSREMMKEFGGAATVAGAFRRSMLPWIKMLGESRINGRLTKILRNTLGSGVRGRRPFKISEHRKMLRGLEFNRQTPVRSTCDMSIQTSITPDRDEVITKLTFPDAQKVCTAPTGATHIQFILHVATLSDFVWNTTTKKYTAKHPDFQSLTNTQLSAPVSIGSLPGSVHTLAASLDLPMPLPGEVTVIAALGVQFFQAVDVEFLTLQEHAGMCVVEVG